MGRAVGRRPLTRTPEENRRIETFLATNKRE
jgi:hypothetical protein